MQAGQTVSPSAMAADVGAASSLDVFERLAERAESEALTIIAAAPQLPGALWRVLPGTIDPLLPEIGRGLAVAVAVVLAYCLVRHLSRRRRARAAAARHALAGMVVLDGLELLALAAAAVTGRALLVRWLGIAPGTGGFAPELAIATVRWLLGLTLALILFQPAVPRFRLAGLDDDGARKAVWRIAILFAIGHVHVVLLNAAQRAGLELSAVRLLSCLVAIGMAVGAQRLLVSLRRHGLPAPSHALAAVLIAATLALWIWGWLTLDFALYYGAIGTITVLLLAFALDRAIAVSIRDSRRPSAMRLLFVLRVVVDAVAAALVIRILVEFWVMDTFGLVSAREWPAFSRRLSFASFVLVLAVALAAAIHAWTEAKLTPPETGMSAQDRHHRIARLSTVLPIVRFVAIGLIAVVFSLVALSALGVDTTPLMAGAGIAGLAISFGSQTLVKDIVSGLFYMVDDVFRLGETIEAGGRSGRLERINLRSVRLRDDAGRVHTVPLGDLGAVTNHSRRLLRLTVGVPLDTMPERAELARFSRNAAAALRSEPMIHAAIAGDIAVSVTEPREDAEGEIALSFDMTAAAAGRAQALVQRLVEEAVEEARLSAVPGPVSVAVSDPPGLAAASEAPGPAAAAQAQAMP